MFSLSATNLPGSCNPCAKISGGWLVLLKYGLFSGMEYGDEQESVSTSTLRTDPVKSLDTNTTKCFSTVRIVARRNPILEWCHTWVHPSPPCRPEWSFHLPEWCATDRPEQTAVARRGVSCVALPLPSAPALSWCPPGLDFSWQKRSKVRTGYLKHYSLRVCHIEKLFIDWAYIWVYSMKIRDQWWVHEWVQFHLLPAFTYSW